MWRHELFQNEIILKDKNPETKWSYALFFLQAGFIG
jgi:hypothetical protein